jgi:WD40 repeat protein
MRRPADDREARLDVAVAAFIQAREAGQAPDPHDWIAQHPDLADGLRDYFKAAGFLDWVLDTGAARLPKSSTALGPYLVLRRVGRGGMGAVFEAVERATGRPVALKVLPTTELPDERERARFVRGVEAAMRLDHPNIVPILDRGEADGIPYYAMPLVDGPDLRVLFRNRHGPSTSPGPLPDGAPRWRAVATIGLQVARALAHAHDRGVLHRDIKPSNLLLDRSGAILVADFDLARVPGDADLTDTAELAGTLRYLAPERFRGWCDPRSDIYSLGLTLYEFLALRPAFDRHDHSGLVNAILNDPLPRPRSLDRTIPRDLETIVRKATEKEPGDRYPTASALADDLDRLLAGRPILARPIGPARRTLQWMRRHKARTAAIAAAILGVVALVVVGFRNEQLRRRSAEIEAIEARYRSVVLRAEQVRRGHRLDDWRERAIFLIAEGSRIRRDRDLRDQLAATFVGVDGVVGPPHDCGASSAAFDRDGRRLLLGGLDPSEGQDGRAKVFDVAADRYVAFSEHAGPGPVAFDPDGRPLHLVAQGTGLLLWDIDRKQARARFELPPGSTPDCLALAADGSKTAASAGGKTFVWDANDPDHPHEFPIAATALAFAPDRSLLATGDAAGNVEVRSLSNDTAPIVIAHGRARIHCLAFAPDPRRDGVVGWLGPKAPVPLGVGQTPGPSAPTTRPKAPVPDDPVGPRGLRPQPPDGNITARKATVDPRSDRGRGWLLAVGDAAAAVVVWDLATGQRRSSCRGSQHDVYTLAFAPDGMTLATAGRYSTRLWDMATGAFLLELWGLDYTLGIAFSPDGRRLAIGSRRLHGPGDWRLADLEWGRGTLELRGLSAPISKVVFAPGGRRVAALAHDWRVGVWDLDQGRLLGVLDGPIGASADNAALVFSPDGTRIALCTGTEAQLRAVDDGRVIGRWTLPPGLRDGLRFLAPDRLLSFRVETADGLVYPDRKRSQLHPYVCRVRELSCPGGQRLLWPKDEFNREITTLLATPDGRQLILQGTHEGPDGAWRATQALDVGGHQIWRNADILGAGDIGRVIDPTCEVYVLNTGVLIDVASGKRRGTLTTEADSLGPRARSWLARSRHGNDPGDVGRTQMNYEGYTLFHELTGPVLSVGIGTRNLYHTTAFDDSGRLIAWGSLEGVVIVCDLAETRRRLAQFGLDW